MRAAIEKMNTDGTLPRGVKVEPFYDRGDLVAITVRTVLHNMFFGIALIFLIQWVFLGNLRCAIIVAATIPVALLLAVIITVLRGESANLLSVGAIDLGIIVDSTVIMLENIFRHLSHRPRREPVGAGARLSEKLHRVLTSAVEVDKPIFFSVIITIAAFLPLFTMQGVEETNFRPDVAHLRLCAARCGDRHLHGHAGALGGAAARARQRDRDVLRALPASDL